MRDGGRVHLEVGSALLDNGGVISKASHDFAVLLGQKPVDIVGSPLTAYLRPSPEESRESWPDLDQPTTGMCLARRGRTVTEYIYSIYPDLCTNGSVLSIYPLPNRKTVAGVLRHISEGEGLSVELTSREREILDLVSQGFTNGAIAEAVALSPDTVKSHLSNIRSKLGVHSRSQAVAVAIRSGMLY
jgi:DNA-binding CsgD family transcriptional regulator